MKKFNLGLISTNRSTIYGISALMIVMYHTTLTFSKPWMFLLNWINDAAHCGPQIFLLVSGISCFFSYTKNKNIMDFYKRRFQRITLPALLTSILWFSFLAPNRQQDIWNFVLDVSGLNLFITGRKTIWFITAISICYLIYPLVHRFFEKYRYSPWALAFLVSVCIMLNVVLRLFFLTILTRARLLFRQIPLFILGAYCGKSVYEQKKLPLNYVTIVVLSMIMIQLNHFLQYYWHDIMLFKYIFYPLSIFLTMLFSIMGNVPQIRKFASFFAPITLEIYLCFEKCLSLVSRAIPDYGTIIINLLAFVLTIITAKLLLRLECFVREKWTGCRNTGNSL